MFCQLHGNKVTTKKFKIKVTKIKSFVDLNHEYKTPFFMDLDWKNIETNDLILKGQDVKVILKKYKYYKTLEFIN